MARARNPKGSGERLRAELLAAANAVLDRTGDPGRVTIRGVAGAVGVAPNAVYLHFPDRDSLLVALVEDRFAAFADHIRAAVAAAPDDAVARMRAGLLAYVGFGLAQPGHYRLLFGDHVNPARADLARRAAHVATAAFEVCVDGCRDLVDAGAAAPIDPWRLATVVWTAVHGYVDIALTGRGSKLPTPDEAVDTLLAALAR